MSSARRASASSRQATWQTCCHPVKDLALWLPERCRLALIARASCSLEDLLEIADAFKLLVTTQEGVRRQKLAGQALSQPSWHGKAKLHDGRRKEVKEHLLLLDQGDLGPLRPKIFIFGQKGGCLAVRVT